MPVVTLDTTANDIVANMQATIAAMESSPGVKMFADGEGVRVIDDVESFLRVADSLGELPEIGIVEGTIEERNGDNDTERKVLYFPFEIIVRFAYIRAPGEGEGPALRRSRQLLEACKTALEVDKSRGGKARLVKWGADVINGTTFRGTIKPLVSRTAHNQAFYAASLMGACAWSKE